MLATPERRVDAETQKRRTIETHDAQAPEFAARYRALAADRYASCFAYSRYRLRGALDARLPRPASGRTLLDVGCGTGHHLAELRAEGFEGTGVDAAPEMVVQARANNPGAAIVLGDVEALPFVAERFDVAMSIEVLRYLPDPLPAVRELARVLRPAGVCLATAAPRFNLNAYWLVNRLATAVPLRGLVRLRQYFTTSAAVRRTFRRAGFTNVEVHGVYVGPVNWIERLVPSALPGALRRWERIDAALADRRVVREFSNMFLIRAVKG